MIDVIDLGLIGYDEAYMIQKELLQKRKRNEIQDTLLVLEHKNIFTVGRSAKNNNLLVSKEELIKSKIDIKKIDRGGDITFHGKGQFVIYPILDLHKYGKDVHKYLNALEIVAIDFLKKYAVYSKTKEGFRGVWVNEEKIASIGVGISSWCTYHGMSINIKNDLKYFDMINSCGIKNCKATSLAKIINDDTLDLKDIMPSLVESFKRIFESIAYEYEQISRVA